MAPVESDVWLGAESPRSCPGATCLGEPGNSAT